LIFLNLKFILYVNTGKNIFAGSYSLNIEYNVSQNLL